MTKLSCTLAIQSLGISFLLGACAPAAEEHISSEGSDLIGGTAIEENESPSAVLLRFPSGTYCTGTVVGQASILTAAHCLSNSNLGQEGRATSRRQEWRLQRSTH